MEQGHFEGISVKYLRDVIINYLLHLETLI